MSKISSISQLDLSGIAWPVCLLEFKTVLNRLCSREVLEVSAQDPEVVDNIIMIVERSEDTLIRHQKDGDIFRLSIRRK